MGSTARGTNSSLYVVVAVKGADGPRCGDGEKGARFSSACGTYVAADVETPSKRGDGGAARGGGAAKRRGDAGCAG